MSSFDDDLARVDQIRRANISARPTNDNPAWKNCHHDCTFLVGFIDKLWNEYMAMSAKADRLADLAMARGERR